MFQTHIAAQRPVSSHTLGCFLFLDLLRGYFRASRLCYWCRLYLRDTHGLTFAALAKAVAPPATPLALPAAPAVAASAPRPAAVAGPCICSERSARVPWRAVFPKFPVCGLRRPWRRSFSGCRPGWIEFRGSQVLLWSFSVVATQASSEVLLFCCRMCRWY